MKGVYFFYNSRLGSSTIRVGSFMFDGETQYRQGGDKDAGEGRRFTLKCKCGSNNWRDNGRSINEYECDSCGQFVTVTEWRD